jgi:hypothetical protein
VRRRYGSTSSRPRPATALAHTPAVPGAPHGVDIGPPATEVCAYQHARVTGMRIPAYPHAYGVVAACHGHAHTSIPCHGHAHTSIPARMRVVAARRMSDTATCALTAPGPYAQVVCVQQGLPEHVPGPQLLRGDKPPRVSSRPRSRARAVSTARAARRRIPAPCAWTQPCGTRSRARNRATRVRAVPIATAALIRRSSPAPRLVPASRSWTSRSNCRTQQRPSRLRKRP